MKKLKFKKFDIARDNLDYENNCNNKLEEWQKENKKREFLEVKIVEGFNRALLLYIVYTEEGQEKSR